MLEAETREAALAAEIQRKAAALCAKHADTLVVICMPTFNPPRELLHRQLASLRAQTHQVWLGIISDDASAEESQAELKALIGDDERFVLALSAERLGVYHNVERCLRLVPNQAEFVALADQDDCWYPHKLRRLLNEFKQDDPQLAYSDLRVVDGQGRVLAESYWTTWRNNQTDLVQLLFENTVTGAAALFRRSLLATALPFPSRVGNLYHDHWLACSALALGSISFIGEPLYDYVQHRNNDVGYFSPVRRSSLSLMMAALKRLVTKPTAKLSKIYEEKVHKPRVIAQTLLQRTETTIEASKRCELQRLAQLEESWATVCWLFKRGLRSLPKSGVGLPAELYALAGILWHKLW
jgi:glycosyltransferase involved in cell wall biosynthesis